MIEDNPEAEGNLVEFYTTLTKLNLEEFWNYREYIFKAIQNKSAISGLNARDGNYLDKSEMALFLYTIADSISDYVEEGEKAEIESYR